MIAATTTTPYRRRKYVATNQTSLGRKQIVNKSVGNYLSALFRKNKKFIPYSNVRSTNQYYVPMRTHDNSPPPPIPSYDPQLHRLLGTLAHVMIYAHGQTFVKCTQCTAPISTLERMNVFHMNMLHAPYFPLCQSCAQ
jgi:hypothetical protein